jgi:hypothetical protein
VQVSVCDCAELSCVLTQPTCSLAHFCIAAVVTCTVLWCPGSVGGSPNTPASNQLHVGLGSGAHSGVVRARAAASRDRVGLAGAAGVPSVSKEVSSKLGFVDAACQFSASRLAAAARRQEEGQEEQQQQQQQQAEEDSTAAAAAAAGVGSLVDTGVGGDDEYAYADDGGDDYGGAGGDDDLNFDTSLGQHHQEDAEGGQDTAAAAAAGAGSSGGGAADASPAPRLPGTSGVGLEQQQDADGDYDMQGDEAGGLPSCWVQLYGSHAVLFWHTQNQKAAPNIQHCSGIDSSGDSLATAACVLLCLPPSLLPGDDGEGEAGASRAAAGAKRRRAGTPYEGRRAKQRKSLAGERAYCRACCHPALPANPVWLCCCGPAACLSRADCCGCVCWCAQALA